MHLPPTVLCALLLSLCGVPRSIAATPLRPNIILIFADDLGWKDVGYNGSEFIETPVLDRLAKEGMVFTEAYATGANCAPSRASLMSGTYTPRHGLFAVGATDRGPKNHQRLVAVPKQDWLEQNVLTIADALKGAGYATGHFGKWHLAGNPTDQGFDLSFNSFGDGEVAEGVQENRAGPPSDPKGVFVLTRKAGEFMEASKGRPFFCYLAHHAPHVPLQARPETLEKFQAKAPGGKDNDILYAACVYDFDESVGILLAKLKELGIEENTHLVFTSDNGAAPGVAQEPLRGAKGSLYEGGIRVPFIVRWPGVTKPGSTSDVPVTNVDLFPTFLAAAGTPVPDGKVLDGENLRPLLDGSGTLQRNAIFWHFPCYLNGPVNRGRKLDVLTGFRSRPVSVIRKGDWKLHLFHEEWQLDGGRDKLDTNHAVELYNLAGDIGEQNDLANTQTAKRDELLDDLLAWFKATDAPLPSEPNPQYDPAAVAPGGGDKTKKSRQANQTTHE